MAQQRNTISIFSAVLAISAVNDKSRQIKAKSDDHFECIMQNKANSPRGKMNAKGFSQRDYENKTDFAVQQNKAKQSQFLIILVPLNWLGIISFPVMVT
jgi:hypothetical protein